MTPTVDAHNGQHLPFLNDLFRDFLRRLSALEAQVRGRAALDGTDPGVPRGQAPAVHESATHLLETEKATALEHGLAAREEDLALALGLMALTGDATFADLPGWGRGAAPPLAEAYPLPGNATLGQRVADLLDSTSPDPALAELYLLALTAGAADALDDAAERRALEASRPELARLALAGAQIGDPLFPQAYPAPRRHGPPRTLPQVRRWILAVPIAALILILATLLSWSSILHDVECTTCSVVQAPTP